MIFGYVFDEGFTVPAAVSIYSLLYNNKHINDIEIVILDDGILQESKNKLKQIANKFNRKMSFVDVDNVKKTLSKTTKYNWNGSYSTYIRLMLNSLLPGCEDIIIMIDGDTIVNGKVDELINIDLQGKLCAMALEAMPYKYHIHSDLGMNKLINGGLLVIDLKKWKEEEAENKILHFLSQVREKNMLTDEDVLSAVFKDKITTIPPRFNYLVQYYLYSSKFYYKFFGWDRLNDNGVFYSLDELQKARDNAIIYHCIDTFTNRPWQKNNIHPYSKMFDKYLAHTPWKDYKKQTRKMSLKQSVEMLLRRFLPSKLSRFLYACAVNYTYGISAKKYYE